MVDVSVYIIIEVNVKFLGKGKSFCSREGYIYIYRISKIIGENKGIRS